jgi:hypothetical protein
MELSISYVFLMHWSVYMASIGVSWMSLKVLFVKLYWIVHQSCYGHGFGTPSLQHMKVSHTMNTIPVY